MIRKPPSLSTLSLPNFSASKPPSPNLVKALRSLILQLPEENRDLIRIVTELIKFTAKHSKETKMPLSNLLLVFCPSLNMNPPLLRALCECEGIWESAPHSPTSEANPDGPDPQISDTAANAVVRTKDIANSSLDADADKPCAVETISKESSPAGEHSMLRTQVTERNDIIPTIYLDSESCPSFLDVTLEPTTGTESSSSTDDVSYVSTSEDPVKNSSPASLEVPHADFPPPLSPSTDSLVTPSTSSFTHLPSLFSKPRSTSAPGSPVIAETTNLPLPRKLVISSPISSPIQFPLAGHIPDPPSPSSRRRSIPLLSLPARSLQPEDSPPSIDQTNTQPKKLSLNLLFVKPSTSHPSATSLISFSPYVHGWSASDSSTSTPTSAVTARSNSSATYLAPMLDTSIDSSPLGLDLPRVGDARERKDNTRSKAPLGDSPQARTPIADLYLAPPVSIQSRHFSADAAPGSVLRTPQPQQALRPRKSDMSFESHAVSSNRLGEPVNVDDGDWTRGVLLAADMNTGWLSPHHSGGGLATAPVH